ncbi:response regulator [Candidatus Magnetobacterium bavaricum]|uniref:Response regulator n=1 Tax=Candidatus Magnetobacterium bavaricum TaxID=29290 RepID=A0A0F3H0T4_9BACT|nr:response regulator [Candidatus Magnetobacterium bavaricum]
MAKILIVDDEPYVRMLLEQTLEDFADRGVLLLTAQNGIEALDVITKERPDIVFLDIMMPGMDGFNVCNKVKNELKLNDIYIVMLTAKGQDSDVITARKAGADLYMTKPFSYDDIVNKTTEILKDKL